MSLVWLAMVPAVGQLLGAWINPEVVRLCFLDHAHKSVSDERIKVVVRCVMNYRSWGSVLLLLAGNALATDLPDDSIFSRYSVKPEELPAVEGEKSVQADPPAEKFNIRDPQPWITVKEPDARHQLMTGNSGLEQMVKRDAERCRREQQNFLRRGEQFPLDCGDDGIGVTIGPWNLD
jgi:hypothetical protein